MVFAAAVREAEAAKVSGALLAEADAWLGRMAAQREACQLCLVHFLLGVNCRERKETLLSF